MKSLLAIARLIALLVLATTSFAAENFQWSLSTSSSGPFYNTKQQAILALKNLSARNIFIGEDKGLVSANHVTEQYKIGTPSVDPTLGDWRYIDIISGAQYPSESELVSAMQAAWATSPQCPGVSMVPSSDWTPSSNPPAPYGSNADSRTYTVSYSVWVSDPQNPHCQSSTSTASASRQRDITCPAYYSLTTTSKPYCKDSNWAYVYRQLHTCSCDRNGPRTTVGNPIDVATGEKVQAETDYSGNGLSLVRTYRSWGVNTTSKMQAGWTHSYAGRLVLAGGVPNALIKADGSLDVIQAVNAKYVTLSGSNIHVLLENGYWSAYYPDGSKEMYDGGGYLAYQVSASGQTTSVFWDIGNKELLAVYGPFGHTIQFVHQAGLLRDVILPDGSMIHYNNGGDVVQYPDGSSRSYLYEDPSNPMAMTGILDEDGVRFATFGYDSVGRATSTQHAGGVESYTVSYGANSATVTDPLLGVTTYTFTSTNESGRRVTNLNRGGVVSQYAVPAYATDIQRRVTQATDPRGAVSKWTYDRDHVLTSTEAYGTSIQRASSYTYKTIYTSQPLVTTAPGVKTTLSYNANNLVQSRTVTDTTVTPNVSRVWTYTYNAYGQVLTENGPRTDVSDVTTYSYYECTNGWQPSGLHCGQLQSITDATGNVTTFDSYNGSGQPTQITHPTGAVSTFSYDARQRLIARCVGGSLPGCPGGELTTLTYRPTGLLQSVTLPDGSATNFGYDAAHRLIQIQDSLGNYIAYTLDAMGNRTVESAYDPANVLRRTHSRVYNTLNQLYRDVSAAATGGAFTEYGYDSSGNQTGVAAPLGRTSANLYDQLNRLKQITDAAAGTTSFSYDSQDNLTSVTDPRGKVTSYTYSGFGNLKTQTSPDTGLTTNTYDAAGNLATTTNARGSVAAYTYDAIGRVTSVAYTKAGSTDQTITFTYDQGTLGKGRLTGAADADHTMAWSYDVQGRVVGKSQAVGAVNLTLAYGYANGHQASLTLPSGNVVTYGYNANGQISSVTVGAATLLSAATHEPFGPIKGWTWGNGTTHNRSYDQEGRPTAITTSVSQGINLSYSYDAASRMTSQADSGSNPNSWNYGYDLLDRLTSALGPTQSQGWTYDANGNRLTETGTQASTFAISTTSNRLNSTTGFINRTYAYDAAGNALSYEDVTLAYNNRGRLISTQKGAMTRSYVYNALGQMVKAIGGAGGTTHYAYDEAGHLVGEYDAAGALIEETVWLGDIPVATLRPGSPVQIYYIHSDHLNTPVRVTQATDNSLRWQWNRDPFGTLPAIENPESRGVFAYNLRFPGQVFDGQAGLHQNMFRDYSPAIGRYVESDPIGLKAGVNTFAYVGGNPVSRKDPSGLACVGLYCYTTPAESAAAKSGNYDGYYQLACAGGDAYACAARHVAANDSFWGRQATDRLKRALKEIGDSRNVCIDDSLILDRIRKNLAVAYADYLPREGDGRVPRAEDIARIHWDEFEKYGLPPNTFGGTPFGGSTWFTNWLVNWCPNCR